MKTYFKKLLTILLILSLGLAPMTSVFAYVNSPSAMDSVMMMDDMSHDHVCEHCMDAQACESHDCVTGHCVSVAVLSFVSLSLDQHFPPMTALIPLTDYISQSPASLLRPPKL